MGLTSLPAQLAGILVLGIGVAYWFGYGATRWLLPREWLAYRWLLMPVVGLTVFAVIAQPLALLGINSVQLVWLLFALALVANATAIWRAPRGAKLARREIFLPLLIGFVAFGLSVLPLFAYGYLTVIGYNVDASTYVAQAEFAKQVGLSSARLYEIPSSFAFTVARTIESGIGAVAGLWLSVAAVLVGRDAFFTFAPLLGLWHAFSFLSVYVLYRVSFRLDVWTSFLALAALALNSVRLLIPLDNFAPHTFALALLPLEWMATQLYFETRTRRALLLAALTFGAQILMYPEATPFYGLPFAIYLLLRIRHWRSVRGELASAVKIGVLTALLAPVAVWTLYKSFVPQVGTVALAIGGTLQTFIPLPQAFGVNALHVLEPEGVKVWDTALRGAWDVFAGIGVVVLIALLSFGLWRAWKAERRLLAASGIAIVLLLAVMFFVQHYPYGFFKTFATGLFVLLALIAFGAETIVKNFRAAETRNRWLFVPIVAVLILFFLMGGSMVWFQTMLAQRDPVVTRRLIQLSNSALVPPNASILLSLTRRSNPRMYWAAYFFRENPIYGNGIVAYAEIHNAQEDIVYDFALLNRDENPVEFGYVPDAQVWQDRWTILYRAK